MQEKNYTLYDNDLPSEIEFSDCIAIDIAEHKKSTFDRVASSHENSTFEVYLDACLTD